MDNINNPNIFVRRMTRSEYMDCLIDLVHVIVQRNEGITVRALHEMANQAILQYGIDNAAARIREGRGPIDASWGGR